MRLARRQRGFIINPYAFAGAGTPTDPYFSSVVLLAHMDGADGSTTFTDVKGKTLTANGNAQLDTATFKYGTASGLFDGAGDYVTTPHHADFTLGSSDFTIEMWARSTTTAGAATLLAKRAGAVLGGYAIYRSGAAFYLFATSAGVSWDIANTISIGAVNTSAFVHIAVTRATNTWRTFNNGTLVSSFSNASAIQTNANSLSFGANPDGSEPYAGWLDDIRITKGVARYVANFTPPSAAFPDS